MKLIVGLGNPDKEYFNTFHNLGFMCVDALAQDLGVEFTKNKCNALIAEARIGKEKIIIAKPQTYMNLSGISVRELMSFYKILPRDLIVLYDDYDLNKGVLRVREKGSSGTHNGMRNIIKEIATEDFARIRIGFKQGENGKIPLINYVLSGIKSEEKELFNNAVIKASKCALDFASGESIDLLKQKYNGKAE